MATFGTSTIQPLELYVTKNLLGGFDITDTPKSAASVRYSSVDLTKREQFIAAALTGFCAHGEGPNQNLYDMASKVADDVIAKMGGAK